MASPLHVSRESEFEVEILRIRDEIQTGFSDLIAWVKVRERELLQQLEEIETSHRMEREKFQQTISELEVMMKLTHENINSENLLELQRSFIKMIKKKQKEFDFQMEFKLMNLVWNDDVLDGIRKFCTLNATFGLPRAEYIGKSKPVLNIGAQGNWVGQFQKPCGVAVDHKSGKIYVADQCNNRVQVFDSKGIFVKMFGYLDRAGKMSKPLYLAISDNRVFVSNLNCLSLYDLDGNFIRQIGTKGSDNLQFNHPRGIAINEVNKDIYVCDSGNNRVQIISKFFTYISEFAIEAPRDIKLTSQHLHVLTTYHPFFTTLNYNFTPTSQTMSTSISNYLKDPEGLCVDGSGKLLISDYYLNQVLIFDSEGTPIYKLNDASIKSPVGIAVDKKGRIVIVCYKPCLLIF